MKPATKFSAHIFNIANAKQDQIDKTEVVQFEDKSHITETFIGCYQFHSKQADPHNCLYGNLNHISNTCLYLYTHVYIFEALT